MDATQLRLDYFQFYEFLNPFNPVRPPVFQLKGQFDKEPMPYRLSTLARFGDRVRKNGEELHDKNAHLTWYAIRPPDVAPVLRQVLAINQFFPNGQPLWLYNPVALLAPAQKQLKPRSPYSPPAKLDHFLVYRVVKAEGTHPKELVLDGEFGKHEGLIYEPVFFAVPVMKRFKTVFEIINPNGHLVIYRLALKEPMEAAIGTKDQFTTRAGMKLGISYLLAAPCLKKLIG